jgi:hypothetical protein
MDETLIPVFESIFEKALVKQLDTHISRDIWEAQSVALFHFHQHERARTLKGSCRYYSRVSISHLIKKKCIKSVKLHAQVVGVLSESCWMNFFSAPV